MSSIVGHAAAGITVFLSCTRWRDPRSRWVLIPCVILAICADFDYFAVWAFGYAADPRFTHSMMFALAVAVVARMAIRRVIATRISITGLLAASLSHPVLDLLVGAHAVPLLWPLGAETSISIGVLPSAGALDPANYYLWRNLLIELGVLLPVFALVIALAQRTAGRNTATRAILIAPVWLVFVAWSISLPR
jgi:inner membrane protein